MASKSASSLFIHGGRSVTAEGNYFENCVNCFKITSFCANKKFWELFNLIIFIYIYIYK